MLRPSDEEGKESRDSASDKLMPDGQTDIVTPWAPDEVKKSLAFASFSIHYYLLGVPSPTETAIRRTVRTPRICTTGGNVMRRARHHLTYSVPSRQFLLFSYNRVFRIRVKANPLDNHIIEVYWSQTSTAKFLWAAQTKKGTACKLIYNCMQAYVTTCKLM